MKIIVNDLHAYEVIHNGHVMISYTKRYNCYEYLHSHHVSFTTAIIWYDTKIYNIESYDTVHNKVLCDWYCIIQHNSVPFCIMSYYMIRYCE